MKPPPFEYHDPESLDEVLGLLHEHGDDAKILAGGQSLIPLLNFRLARPEVLIDINRLSGLDVIQTQPDGGVSIGAMTRQTSVEHSDTVAQVAPLVIEALAYVAHPQIRNRGTVGGSVAHADPAAELPVVMVTAGAQMHVRGASGSREISAEEFFLSYLTTALGDDELLTEVRVPVQPARTGVAFEEFARRSGDYALGGAGALITLDEGGVCRRARLGLLAAGDTPVRARQAEAILEGESASSAVVEAAAEAAVVDLDPPGNIHGDAGYRRQIIKSMVIRAVSTAHERVEGVGV